MILQTCYFGDDQPTVVTENPSAAEVARTVQAMDWYRFAFVTLHQDEDNWLDGSGCLPDDGLSMMLSQDGIRYVTETAPPTPESMLALFNAYLRGDEAELFALLYDAQRRGLSARDVEALRRDEEREQQQRRS